MNIIPTMSDEEYMTALAKIVATGRGHDAISRINKMLYDRAVLAQELLADKEATLRAIHKTAASNQTAGQKIKAIKAYSEEEQ